MKKFSPVIIAILLLFSCKSEPTEELSVVEKIAAANGLEDFEKLEEIRYTFNVRVNDSLRTSRAWQWDLTNQDVTLTTADTSISYNHSTEAAAHPETDHRFINDQYWLLFPFHLVWDQMEYEHFPEATAPISGKKMQQLTVKYPADEGYTPGDVYEVFFDENYMIQEWVYKSGGSEENPFASTWEDYENFGGLKIAKKHQNQDGTFELFFSDISVR